MDWDIYGDNGILTLKIIKSLIDLNSNGSLKLIVIYSAETLDHISDSIIESLKEYKFNNDENYTFVKGHTRISIFNKEKIGLPERSVSLDALPDCLALELSNITAGLVSNVALKSMSTLRKNTHLILGKLGHEIDSAYLSHRCLLPYPEDAKHHLVDIIADEFHCLLNDLDVSEHADFNTTKMWMKHFNPDSEYNVYPVNDPNFGIIVDEAKILKMLESGYDKTKKSIKYTYNEEEKDLGGIGYRQLSRTFYFGDKDFNKNDYKFAILTSQKSRYSTCLKSPILTQGTILEGDVEDHDCCFWLCIKQKCDCVRLSGNTNFSFVPLEKIESATQDFDLVIVDSNINYTKLKINIDTHESKLFEFSPDSNQKAIIGVPSGDIFLFKTSNEIPFTWVSELKDNHALRISNLIARNLSRIGLDEYEWQRRWSQIK